MKRDIRRKTATAFSKQTILICLGSCSGVIWPLCEHYFPTLYWLV